MPYLAVDEVQGDYAEQLCVIRDQPVRVLDSMRRDWWLVSTIPDDEGEDATPPSEGWVRADILQPGTGMLCMHVLCMCMYVVHACMCMYVCAHI